MEISLTPKELRDLLAPPLMRMHVPLDLDRMTANEFAAVINSEAATIGTDRDELAVQRSLLTATADLAQAKEELQRTRTMHDEAVEELKLLNDKIGALRRTPIAQANAVIENAGKQAHDLARIFFLECGGPAWYQGIRATAKNLLDTLGVEVEESLEEHLKPREATLEEPAQEPPAAAPDAVPPAGQMRTTCKTCGHELRLYPEGWIDAETHATGEDGHAHDPDLEDIRCEHGLAADMHCCECRRSGFFPPEGCDCYTTGVDVGDGDAVAAAIETDHRVIAQAEADAGRGTVDGEAALDEEIEF